VGSWSRGGQCLRKLTEWGKFFLLDQLRLGGALTHLVWFSSSIHAFTDQACLFLSFFQTINRIYACSKKTLPISLNKLIFFLRKKLLSIMVNNENACVLRTTTQELSVINSSARKGFLPELGVSLNGWIKEVLKKARFPLHHNTSKNGLAFFIHWESVVDGSINKWDFLLFSHNYRLHLLPSS